MRRRAAIAMVTWARAHVPLYRELYEAAAAVITWRDFRRLPVLTDARLRATPLAHQVDDLNDVLRTFTPYRLQSVVTPGALVADQGDTDAIFEEYRDALALAGVRAGVRLVMLAPPYQRYFAAELADVLGYFGVEAHVIIGMGSNGLVRSVAALAPDAVLGLGGGWPPAVQPSITVRDLDGAGADLYVVPGAGIVAVRPHGEAAYRPLTRSHLLEGARDGRLLLTALRRYHQPLIRYELPDRGRLAGRRLWLAEVAP